MFFTRIVTLYNNPRFCFCFIQNKEKGEGEASYRVNNEATKFNHHPTSPNSSCVSTAETQLCSEKGEAWQFAILNEDKRKTVEKIKS